MIKPIYCAWFIFMKLDWVFQTCEWTVPGFTLGFSLFLLTENCCLCLKWESSVSVSLKINFYVTRCPRSQDIKQAVVVFWSFARYYNQRLIRVKDLILSNLDKVHPFYVDTVVLVMHFSELCMKNRNWIPSDSIEWIFHFKSERLLHVPQ